jgi:hypothetical protein
MDSRRRGEFAGEKELDARAKGARTTSTRKAKESR